LRDVNLEWGGGIYAIPPNCNFEELKTTFIRNIRIVEYVYMNIMVIK
jgi:hypothetical protein